MIEYPGGGMKIAIGTIDGMKLQQGHFGMSPFFMIYELEDDGKVRFIEKLVNPYSDPEVHKHAETSDIMGVLSFVDVYIGKRMGKKSQHNIVEIYKRKAYTYEDLNDVEDALSRYLEKG